jgi:hypothetical protein
MRQDDYLKSAVAMGLHRWGYVMAERRDADRMGVDLNGQTVY